MALLVAVDFDAITQPPEPSWISRSYDWCGQHRFMRWLHRRLTPLMLRRFKISRDADTAAWWMIDKGLRIQVIVRLPYILGLRSAVESVLGDFPTDRIHLVVEQDLAGAAMDIQGHCRQERVVRFFTRDRQLARYLPTSLVRWVDQWDESILH
jgi:hypothetical protein